MSKNSKEPEPVPNGPTRHGQFPWHDENCQVQIYGIKSWPPYRAIWCVTHNQWAHEVPTQVIYMFADGTTTGRKRRIE